MKKRATQLMSLLISAAVLTGSPCLPAAADLDSESISDDVFSEGSSGTDSPEGPSAADSTSQDSSDTASSDMDPSSDISVNPEPSEGEDISGASDDLELSQDTSSADSDPLSEDDDPFDDGQDSLFSDGDQEGQALAGEIDDNSYHTLSASENYISQNISAQNYFSYGNVICSHLIANGNGYLRIEEQSSALIIQQYDSGFHLKSTSSIANELAYFGGFYAGANNYYVVYGQGNPDEDNSKEVLRLVKYDRSWNRLGSVSLCGANTILPFSAGSLRMYEYGDQLFVRTCHSMYASEDGYNHQANLTWQINTASMTTVDSYSGIMNVGIGYVSHSFNQFILVDDAGNIVALDHGDAYPRSAVLGKYAKKAGADGFLDSYYHTPILSFQGETGSNYTGASLGGLEYSGSSYLAAGNSVAQDSQWLNHNTRNIFISVTPRTDSSELSSSLKWITSYSENDGLTTSTPHLVKLGSNSFLLLWELYESDEDIDSTTPAPRRISYVFLDGSGNLTSSVYTRDGSLSDCKPSVYNGTATWYVTDGEKLTFYQISSDGSLRSETGHMNSWTPELKFSKNTLSAGLIEKNISNPLTAKTDGTITYTSSDPSVATVDNNGKLTLKGVGTCTITASSAAGTNYAAGSASYTLKVLDLKQQTLNVKTAFSCTYGDKSFSLNASCTGNTPISYVNKNNNVVSVSSTGVITPKNAGTAKIVITAARSDSYLSDTKTVTVTVKPKDLKKCRMIFTKTGPVPFNYSEIQKYIALADGSKILKPGEDYYLGGGSFSGISSVTYVSFYFYGYGNYTGNVIQSGSTISSKTQLRSAVSTSRGNKLSWQKENCLGYYIYRKPVNGKYSLVKKITSGSTVSWTDTDSAKNPGFYTYAVKAYTKNSSKTVFAQLSAAKTAASSPVLLSAVSSRKTVRLTYKKVAGASGYTVYRLKGKSWSAAGNTRSTSFTDKKPGSAKKYRIRAYRLVKGKKIYGPYSSVKTVK